MKRIDLSCLIGSPILVALVMSKGGSASAVLVLLAWNMAAWLPECVLLQFAQQNSAALR